MFALLSEQPIPEEVMKLKRFDGTSTSFDVLQILWEPLSIYPVKSKQPQGEAHPQNDIKWKCTDSFSVHSSYCFALQENQEKRGQHVVRRSGNIFNLTISNMRRSKGRPQN